jgi:hypothetical protein
VLKVRQDFRGFKELPELKVVFKEERVHKVPQEPKVLKELKVESKVLKVVQVLKEP